MNTDERLYNLLPAFQQLRDTGQGAPLRALLAVIEAELDAVQSDIDALYDDAFIETSAEWVVPYIGDLMGVRSLRAIPGVVSQRAYVANALAYRRRKGTAAVLEQLARDVTGWPCRVVEFFERLTVTQNLNHVRYHNVATASLRDATSLELTHGPFERTAHTGEVRRIEPGRGRYNIPNIGLFVWRLTAYTREQSTPAPAVGGADGTYTLHPLGRDVPLFNSARSETGITGLADEINVPTPLRRRPLYNETEAVRQAAVDGGTPPPLDYFGLQPVFSLTVDDVAVPVERLRICDLSEWDIPVTTADYTPANGDPVVSVPITAALDPVMGRLAFATPPDPASQIDVTYHYGFPGDLGGGPYDRRPLTPQQGEQWWLEAATPYTFHAGVTKNQTLLTTAPDPTQLHDTLSDALTAWNAHAAATVGAVGVITILDNATYDDDLTGPNAIVLPAGARLAIVAGEWPITRDPLNPNDPTQGERVVGNFVPRGAWPCVTENIEIEGTAPTDNTPRAMLALDGLLIGGTVLVRAGDLGHLDIAHCTLAPQQSSLAVAQVDAEGQRNQDLQLSLTRTISGPITLPPLVSELTLTECIVDGLGADDLLDAAVTAPDADTHIAACTFWGLVTVRTVHAENSIFNSFLAVARRQSGCVRFSWLADGSATPRRYRCQPDLELHAATEAAGGTLDPAMEAQIRLRTRPTFTTRHWPASAYAQLSDLCPSLILAGAEDGAEMGGWHFLANTLRLANLRGALAEYLPLGREAGIIHVT